MDKTNSRIQRNTDSLKWYCTFSLYISHFEYRIEDIFSSIVPRKGFIDNIIGLTLIFNTAEF